jgi:hypothetical protein
VTLLIAASTSNCLAQAGTPRATFRTGDWVVPVACAAMYLQGSQQCRAVNVYKMLLDVRDDLQRSGSHGAKSPEWSADEDRSKSQIPT